jgi:hypothetical protein
MTKEEKNKYAYECMVKNNPDEAVKQLLLKDKMIINKRRKITKAIEYIEQQLKDDCSEFMYMAEPDTILNILRGADNED